MRREIRLPAVGTDAQSGLISSWRTEVGAYVKRGEVIAEIETDKATLDFGSPIAGQVVELVYPAGVELPAGTVIAWLDDQA